MEKKVLQEKAPSQAPFSRDLKIEVLDNLETLEVLERWMLKDKAYPEILEMWERVSPDSSARTKSPSSSQEPFFHLQGLLQQDVVVSQLQGKQGERFLNTTGLSVKR